MTFEWTVLATMSALTMSVVAILAVLVFRLRSQLDRLEEVIDGSSVRRGTV